MIGYYRNRDTGMVSYISAAGDLWYLIPRGETGATCWQHAMKLGRKGIKLFIWRQSLKYLSECDRIIHKLPPPPALPFWTKVYRRFSR